MSTTPIRIGLLGAGSVLVRRHLPALQALGPGCRIAAVARGDAAKLAEARAATGAARGHADWRALAADPEIDAVVISSPNVFHAEQALAALEAGKDVFCEKPPAASYAQALRVARAAEARGRILQYGFMLRFADETQRARNLVAAGQLGACYHARALWLRRRGYPAKGSWFTTRALSGGGVLADLGCHLLDAALYVLGYPEVQAVSALTHARLRESKVDHRARLGRKPGGSGVCDVEDLGAALFRLAGGASLVLEASFAANLPELPAQLDVLGDRAGLRVEFGKGLALYGEAQDAVTDTLFDPGYAGGLGDSIFLRQMEHFLHCVRTRETPRADAAQGAALMRALEAAYRSAELGREVRLDEVEG